MIGSVAHKNYVKAIFSFLQSRLLLILLILFYLTEGYSKYYMLTFGERPLIAKSLKIALILFILIKVINNLKFWIRISLIILMFAIGQIFINPNFQNDILISFIKYLFPILLFTYFNRYKIDAKLFYHLEKVFELLLFTNSILILIGFIFNVNLFETYIGHRFGYNGLLVSSASGSYAYIITNFYFLIKYRERLLFQILPMFIISTSIIIGTKAIYLSLVVISLLYFFLYAERKSRVIGMITVSMLAIIFAYLTFFKFGLMNDLRIKDGLLSSGLSYRDKLLTDQMIPFIRENWLPINYIFGGINDPTTKVQMGLFDLFYFFGILGMLLYLYLYIKTYITFPINRIKMVFLLFLLLIILLTGNFFLNASVVIYMLFIRETVLLHN